MREILFRGKVLEDNDFWGVKKNQWLYGNLCIDILADSVDIEDTSKEDIVRVTVDPKTVGQYTGVKDKNGKKIFEGDIVKFIMSEQNYKSEVYFDNGGFCIRNSMIRNLCLVQHYADDFSVEIIGNIHDNPELLEG